MLIRHSPCSLVLRDAELYRQHEEQYILALSQPRSPVLPRPTLDLPGRVKRSRFRW